MRDYSRDDQLMREITLGGLVTASFSVNRSFVGISASSSLQYKFVMFVIVSVPSRKLLALPAVESNIAITTW